MSGPGSGIRSVCHASFFKFFETITPSQEVAK